MNRNKHNENIQNHNFLLFLIGVNDQHIQQQTANNNGEKGIDEQALEPIKFNLVICIDTAIKGTNWSNCERL